MSNQVVLAIKQGKLRGTIEKTQNNIKFASFMGIPYAKPPVGDLKFKAPQPPTPWEGILDANQENNACLAHDLLQNVIYGEFDCLYLNVYTPQIVPENNGVLKPVMVWIHGGGFTCGSKNRDFYDPIYFMDKDVVIVAINYRLGVLGFLSLTDHTLGVSGNAGLKDQSMALKWVQKNIKVFGGDPNNVTLFGESAGGASVSYQLLSPMSKGLFQKVIIQSGVANCSWAEGHTDLRNEMLKALGKTASNEAELLKILENVTREELIAAQMKVPDPWKPRVQRFISPTVETSTCEERFLPDSPINMLRTGNYNKVPVMIGVTSCEGMLMNFITGNSKEEVRPSMDVEFAPYWLNMSSAQATETGKKIKEFYYGDKDPLGDNMESKLCFYNYISDVYFCKPSFEFMEHLLETSKNQVFLYNFDANTKLNVFKKMFNIDDIEGICHGEDIMYLFKTAMSPPVEPGSEEHKFIQTMTTWWTNFAKYTNPNGTGNDQPMGIEWPAATDKLEYLNITSAPSVKANFGNRTTNFWKSIENKA